MALLDFLKKKKEVEKSKKPAKKAEKVSAVVKEAKEAKPEPKPAVKANKPKKTTGFSFEAVKQPHISEKASYLAEKDQYIFEIGPSFNKNEVKKAVSGIYGVDVLSVNIVKIPAKKRRLGRTQGWRKGYKKAIVKIKEGQKIEIL